jgi:hypothetical protein
VKISFSSTAKVYTNLLKYSILPQSLA